jgi:hypothetical protein
MNIPILPADRCRPVARPDPSRFPKHVTTDGDGVKIATVDLGQNFVQLWALRSLWGKCLLRPGEARYVARALMAAATIIEGRRA